MADVSIKKKRKIVRSFSLAWCGKPKSGKSTLLAKIIKKYGGIVCDFSRIDQYGGLDHTAIKYNVAVNAPRIVGDIEEVEVGEAWTACQKVGLPEEYYKLIRCWKDFEDAIAYARVLQEDILQKKIFIGIDDTDAMRWHKVLSIAEALGHKNPVKNDWGATSTELKLLVTKLSKEFNLALVNQMMEEYSQVLDTDGTTKIKEKNGAVVPNWIPKSSDYLVDGMFEIIIDASTKPRKQLIKIHGGREVWQCDPNFEEIISDITPERIMKALGITEDRL